MRELKFKAYIKEYKQLRDVQSIDFRGKLKPYICAENYYAPHEIELLEYTGVKDINNIEIYTGNIVRYKERNLEKAFGMDKGEDFIEKTRVIKFSNLWFNVPQGFVRDLEVIGNIYENPELIKGGN